MLSLAVSSDGQRIATSDGTNVVRLWNATDGKKVADLKGNARLSRETGREDGELAFSKAELKYFTDELKKRGDEKKKVIDRKTKGEKDLKTAQEKPIAEKKAVSDKARAERDAADKKVEETTKKAEETQKAFEAKETASKAAEAKSKEVAAKVVVPEGLEKSANQTLEGKKNDLAAKKKTRESLINTKLNPAKQKLEKATQFFIEVEKKRVEMELLLSSLRGMRSKRQSKPVQTLRKRPRLQRFLEKKRFKTIRPSRNLKSRRRNRKPRPSAS